tara:strand:- start:134 stop:370 length:237 start_codon:yes stop_codon:yes gene_type:complete
LTKNPKNYFNFKQKKSFECEWHPFIELRSESILQCRKSGICHKKFVGFAISLFHGERNGRKTGKIYDTVHSDVEINPD